MSRLVAKRRKWRTPKTFNVDREGARILQPGAGPPSGYEVFNRPADEVIVAPEKAHAYINRRGERITIDPRTQRKEKDIK